MSNLQEIQEKMIAFRDDRDWKQFHTPKNIAISLVLEAGEVLEHFQWISDNEVEQYIDNNKAEIADEISDTLSYLLLLAHELGINLEEAFDLKLRKNELKYPIAKAKGNHTKYNRL